MVISYYWWFSQPVLRCSSQYPLRSVVVFAQPRLRQARGMRGGQGILQYKYLLINIRYSINRIKYYKSYQPIKTSKLLSKIIETTFSGFFPFRFFYISPCDTCASNNASANNMEI